MNHLHGMNHQHYYTPSGSVGVSLSQSSHWGRISLIPWQDQGTAEGVFSHVDNVGTDGWDGHHPMKVVDFNLTTNVGVSGTSFSGTRTVTEYTRDNTDYTRDYTDNTGSTETRPENYTIKIWKRIS